jgi:hypothetical protein
MLLTDTKQPVTSILDQDGGTTFGGLICSFFLRVLTVSLVFPKCTGS